MGLQGRVRVLVEVLVGPVIRSLVIPPVGVEHRPFVASIRGLFFLMIPCEVCAGLKARPTE